MISLRDLEWAAGFMEGEGSFHSKKSTGSMIVQASQKQKWPLEKLVSLFGGHIYLNKRDIWGWSVEGMQGAGLAMTLFPLLSPRRKEQI